MIRTILQTLQIELDKESDEYANDRDGVPESRIEESAMSYRDGYRCALGDIRARILKAVSGDGEIRELEFILTMLRMAVVKDHPLSER